MRVRFPSRGRAQALALGVLVCLPSQVLAAPSSPARKAPSGHKPPAAPADYASQFASAVKSYESFDYEQALAGFNKAKALARGTEQEVPVWLYLGIVQAELGNREQSLAAFRTALYLQPDAKLPVKVSPREQSDFEEVRKAVVRDLGLETPVTAAPAPPAAVPVTPPAVTTPAVVATADRPVQTPALDTRSPAATPPTPQAVSFMPALQAERTPGPSQRVPLMLLGTSAVAGAGAVVFGLLSSHNINVASGSAYYDVRQGSLDSANRQAVIADVLMGTAGAAALASLATYLFNGNSTPTSAPSAGGSP